MFRRYAGKHALTCAVKALSVRARIGIITAALAGLSVAGLMLPTSAPSAAASSTCVPDYAFVNDPGIALRTQCDTAQTQLTTGGDFRPTLSPDGKHVAFVRVNNNATNPEDAEIMPTTGGDPVQLPGWNNVSYISWSPTGSQFVIVKNEDGVYIVNTDGTISSTILPDYSGSVNAAVWCGNKIVYDESDGFDHVINIYAANTDGTGATQLTSNGTDTWPACSPDGKWVFFQEASTTDPTLFHVSVVPLSGGTPVQVTADAGDGAMTPTVSADWTLGWYNNSSPQGLQFMWLGGTTVVNGPQGVLYEPSFASGDGSIPAPAGFPIAYNSTAPSPTPTATASCPAVQFFGLRGSGEEQSDDGGSGYGSTVGEFERTLTQLDPAVSATEVDYPAVPVLYTGLVSYTSTYNNSVAAGKNALQTALSVMWHRCPSVHVVLAGYSQGAQVAGDVADTLPGSERALVTAVALFGDPRFNGAQSRVDVAATGYSKHRGGIIVKWPTMHSSLRQVPSDLVSRFQSYCIENDPICNWTPQWLSVCAAVTNPSWNPAYQDCPHVQYVVREWPYKAAYWERDMLKARGL